MKTDCPYKMTTVANTEPGDIFGIQNGTGTLLALRLAGGFDYVANVAVLRSSDEGVKPFRATACDMEAFCAVYGAPLLEVAPQAPLGAITFDEPVGSIYARADELIMRLAGDPRRTNGGQFLYANLATGAVRTSHNEHGGLVTAGWRLWANAEDRNRPGAIPLLEFSGASG